MIHQPFSITPIMSFGIFKLLLFLPPLPFEKLNNRSICQEDYNKDRVLRNRNISDIKIEESYTWSTSPKSRVETVLARFRSLRGCFRFLHREEFSTDRISRSTVDRFVRGSRKQNGIANLPSYRTNTAPFYTPTSQKRYTFNMINDSHAFNPLNSRLDLDSKKAQNPKPHRERGSEIVSENNRDSVPQSTPPQVDLYYLRFINSTFSWDMTKVVDEVWKDKLLTFEDKLGFIYKLVTWDRFDFDVDSADMYQFIALKYAVKVSIYKKDAYRFFIKHIHSMNYPSKLASVMALSIFDEAKECLETLMETSREWEIIEQSKFSLRLIYERSYPDELHKVDFDVADRADPNTKPDLERARTIRFVPVEELGDDE